MKTIAEAWLSYRLNMPRVCGLTQLRETRRAFYAGAAAYYGILMEMANSNASDDIGATLTGQLHGELAAFQQLIGTSAEDTLP